MIDKEEKYWLTQYEIYNNIENVPAKLKYKEWQPARWAGNLTAALKIKKIASNLNSILEVGAGSAAFSFQLKELYPSAVLNAIDISPIAKKYCLAIAKDLNVKINYKLNDLFLEHDLKSDITVSLGVIEHFEKEKQNEFIEKMIELSNKYILIAIPNQSSKVFKSYVEWAKKNDNEYEEKHQSLNIDDLEKMLVKKHLKILLKDGFQIYLSEKDFVNSVLKQDIYINKLKTALLNQNKQIGSLFPNYSFHSNDIIYMSKAELSLSKRERLKFGFMSYILAEK